jgi:hypothetical protein
VFVSQLRRKDMWVQMQLYIVPDKLVYHRPDDTSKVHHIPMANVKSMGADDINLQHHERACQLGIAGMY